MLYYFLLQVTRLHMCWLERVCVCVCVLKSVFVCMFMCVQDSYTVKQRPRKAERKKTDLHTQRHTLPAKAKRVCVLTVHVADLAVLDCWKDTWKACGPG